MSLQFTDEAASPKHQLICSGCDGQVHMWPQSSSTTTNYVAIPIQMEDDYEPDVPRNWPISDSPYNNASDYEEDEDEDDEFDDENWHSLVATVPIESIDISDDDDMVAQTLTTQEVASQTVSTQTCDNEANNNETDDDDGEGDAEETIDDMDVDGMFYWFNLWFGEEDDSDRK